MLLAIFACFTIIMPFRRDRQTHCQIFTGQLFVFLASAYKIWHISDTSDTTSERCCPNVMPEGLANILLRLSTSIFILIYGYTLLLKQRRSIVYLLFLLLCLGRLCFFCVYIYIFKTSHLTVVRIACV